jgi:hypothetical protein
MNQADDCCETVVRVGEVAFVCDQRVNHESDHGGVYPGYVDSDGRPIDVDVRWAESE